MMAAVARSDSDSHHDLPQQEPEFVIHAMDDPHRHHRRPPAPPRCQMPRPPVLPPVVVHHGGYALPLRDDRRKKLSCLFITKLIHLALMMFLVAATLAMTARLPKELITQGAAGVARIACPVAIALLAVSWIVIFAVCDDGANVYQQ
ncbi:hypothetical protein ACQ4PT_023564 [Festuca glaucescens]